MLTINDDKDIDYIVILVANSDENYFIDIKNTYLKNYFLHELKKYVPETYIINCNCSERRMMQDLQNVSMYDLIVFDCVRNINDIEQLNILNRKLYIY